MNDLNIRITERRQKIMNDRLRYIDEVNRQLGAFDGALAELEHVLKLVDKALRQAQGVDTVQGAGGNKHG